MNNFSLSSIETFYGCFHTEADCLILIDEVRKGTLGRITRRLSDNERRQIRSGSIFVYCEEESKVKRWTDNRAWTPSRVQGVFLVYKELLSSEVLIKKTYSAVCNGKNYHVVGYQNINDEVIGLCCRVFRSIKDYFGCNDVPQDIKMKRKQNFKRTSEKSYRFFQPTPVSLSMSDEACNIDIPETWSDFLL